MHDELIRCQIYSHSDALAVRSISLIAAMAESAAAAAAAIEGSTSRSARPSSSWEESIDRCLYNYIRRRLPLFKSRVGIDALSSNELKNISDTTVTPDQAGSLHSSSVASRHHREGPPARAR